MMSSALPITLSIGMKPERRSGSPASSPRLSPITKSCPSGTVCLSKSAVFCVRYGSFDRLAVDVDPPLRRDTTSPGSADHPLDEVLVVGLLHPEPLEHPVEEAAHRRLGRAASARVGILEDDDVAAVADRGSSTAPSAPARGRPARSVGSIDPDGMKKACTRKVLISSARTNAMMMRPGQLAQEPQDRVLVLVWFGRRPRAREPRATPARSSSPAQGTGWGRPHRRRPRPATTPPRP